MLLFVLSTSLLFKGAHHDDKTCTTLEAGATLVPFLVKSLLTLLHLDLVLEGSMKSLA